MDPTIAQFVSIVAMHTAVYVAGVVLLFVGLVLFARRFWPALIVVDVWLIGAGITLVILAYQSLPSDYIELPRKPIIHKLT